MEYDRAERNAGVTGYPYKKMINLALNGITVSSNVPIKFVSFWLCGVYDCFDTIPSLNILLLLVA
jgi:hypothetical protein